MRVFIESPPAAVDPEASFRRINRFFALSRELGRHAGAAISRRNGNGVTAGRAGMDATGHSGAARRSEAAVPEIAACLALKRDVWIFGYGSLMWDPGFPYCQAEPALLRGYHRRFCVYSHGYRGTPERPGLVLGLDRGGACKGIAFRVPAVDVEAALHYLWDREMRNRTYHLKELAVETPGRRVKARAFIVDRAHASYAGRLSLAETARLIHQGTGARGSCRQYLERTVRQLEALGVIDGPLHRLERQVKVLAAAEKPCAFR
jgi:glutathione-specific gamma-glutamylcyclotransferase